MKATEIRNILEEDLRPKYEKSRDSYINLCMDLKAKYRELFRQVQNKEVEHKTIWGEYNSDTCKKEGGFLQTLTKEQVKLIDENRKWELQEVTAYYTKKFEKQINNLLDSLVAEIVKHNPKKVELGYSEHDFNFILNIDGTKRSFTINTIIAGGYIQCIHYRTLKKLHKGIV